MPALPRTYFDSPTPAVDMTGWSEERRRFFMLNGYDRGPATPETTVKVTETPPDDPTPTTRVTTTKYPEGMEQPGMQGDPYAGLLGGQEPSLWEQINRGDTYPEDLPEYGPAGIEESFRPERLLDPRDQDYAAGLPAEDITPAPSTAMLTGDFGDLGSTIAYTTDEGEEVTIEDLVAAGMPAGRVRAVVGLLQRVGLGKASGQIWGMIKKYIPSIRRAKTPAGPAPTAAERAASAWREKLITGGRFPMRHPPSPKTAAVVGGTLVGAGVTPAVIDQFGDWREQNRLRREEWRQGQAIEAQPSGDIRGPASPEGLLPAVPPEEDVSVAEGSGTTPEVLVDQFEEAEGQPYTGGLLMGDDPTWGSGELEDVAGQDVGEMKEELDRYYDYFPEDIDAKRDRYLKGLKEIYKKVAILNVIAALTNSPSQAGAFMQMAAEKFKALEGFRGEERLQKIARGVFFTEDGQFDAPQSKQDAFNRAIRFGASHEEALALSGHRKEYAPTTTAPPGYVTWNRTDPDTGEMIEESFRKGVHPRDLGYGEGWSVGQGRAPTEPAWYRSMQRIETTLRSYGRKAAIDELIWFWGSDPWFRMVFGEELEEQAALHVDKILAGRTPPLPTEGGGAGDDYAYEGVVE